MTDYVLPRTESGEVDFVMITIQILVGNTHNVKDILKAIDANARAEERERCIKVIQDQEQAFLSDEYATGQPQSSMVERVTCRCIVSTIRNIGDSHE